MKEINKQEIPELVTLLGKVEERFGRRIATTSDFEALSVVIEHDVNELLSPSTLKRLWGYVSSKPIPRMTTLDILARYTGARNFIDFCEILKAQSDDESDFNNERIIIAERLAVGDIVTLQWNPDRLVRLEYCGWNNFAVIESRNSKLLAGDHFEATCFLLGHPLYIPGIARGSVTTSAYIAGSKNGLTRIELQKK